MGQQVRDLCKKELSTSLRIPHTPKSVKQHTIKMESMKCALKNIMGI
jgi:hypothetical protein